jgi:AcrR family transcriptional regulator
MSEIAARAQTAFGSLYQFFPSKEAIGEAVASRYLDQLRQYLAATPMGEIAQAPFATMLDALIDPFIAFVAQQPGFQVFLRDAKRMKHLAAAQALYAESLAWVDGLLAQRTPALETAQRQVVAMLVVQCVGMAMELAVSPDIAHQTTGVQEVKAMLGAYLQLRVAGTEGR